MEPLDQDILDRYTQEEIIDIIGDNNWIAYCNGHLSAMAVEFDIYTYEKEGA